KFRDEQIALAIVAVSKQFDREAFLKSALPGAVETKTTNGSYYLHKASKMAFTFIGRDVFAFGEPENIASLVDKRAVRNADLAPALQAANSKRQITGGMLLKVLPGELIADSPKVVHPILRAKLAYASVDLAVGAALDLNLRYQDDAAAVNAETAVADL